MIAALVLMAQAEQAAFAPPLDTPLRIVTERVETHGDTVRRFRTERTVRFARADVGYRAEVTLVAAQGEGVGDSDAMFEAFYAALSGRTLAFALSGTGEVIALADQAEAWGAVCQAMAALAARSRTAAAAEREALAKRLAAPICAMPEAQQRATLGSLVAALVPEAAGVPGAAEPVRVPVRGPGGAQAQLSGTRTTRASAGTVVVETSASGTVAAPQGAARVDYIREVRIDAATGLVAGSRETIVTRLGTRADAPREERVTTLEIARVR